MHFPGGKYCRLNGLLFSSIGLWPYASSRIRYAQICIVLVVLVSGVVVQLNALITTDCDMDTVLRVFMFAGPWINYTIKYVCIAIRSKNIKMIMERIERDWNERQTKEEVQILREYNKRGNFVTVCCVYFAYSTVCYAVLLVLVPNFLDILAPLDQPRPHHLPYLCEYFFDQEEYFVVVVIHLAIVCLAGATVVISTETFMLNCVYHSCAMYKVACHQIQRALEKNCSRTISIVDAETVYKNVVDGIITGYKTVEYSKLLFSSFLHSYVCLLPIGIGTLTINLYRLSMMTSFEDPEDTVLCALFVLAHFGYFFLVNYMGQTVNDHGSLISQKAYEAEWYGASVKVQKLILSVIQAGSRTCGITLYGLVKADMEGFVSNAEISLFEMNIRFMGSLLACYALTGDIMFRDKATQLGERMLPAFQTETGISHSLINLHTGASKNYGWASSGCSILSEIGTMHLEFTYLSDITGNPVFRSKVENVRKVLNNLEKPKGLYPNYIHPKTGKWGQHHMSLGGLGDSFYEYLLKAWIQSGKKDEEARTMYDEAIAAIDEHMIKVSPGKLLYVSDLKYDRPEHKMGHLACFAGGMFALGAKTLQNELSDRYMTIAAGLTNTCHESYDRSVTKLGPEAFHFIEGNEAKSLKNGEKYYILRPETFESYFVMWRLTKDPKYREWGWEAVQALEKYCRVPGGFSGLQNVYLPEPPKDDVQQSYFFAETLKYLYLLFSDDDLINLDDWVFNSEAHVLPIRTNPLYRPAPNVQLDV